MDAFEEAKIALDIDKDFAAAYGLRGAALHYRKDDDKAKLDMEEAVRRDPADTGSLLWRARFYYDRKEYADALKDLDRALKLDENYLEAHRDRAEVCEKLDKPDDAAKERKRVEELEAQASSAPRSKPGFMAERFFGKVPGAMDKRLRRAPSAQRPPSAEKLMRDEAMAMAEEIRPSAIGMQQRVVKVDAVDLLPEPCASLGKTLQRAQDLFKHEEYELATLNYRSLRLQSEEVLQKYETLLSTQPEIWLKWAREKAARVQDPKSVWALWITMAEVEQLFGNREEQHRALKKGPG